MPGSRISRKTIRLFVLLFIFLLFLRDNFVFNFSMFCLFVWCALSCSYLGHFFRRRRYWLRLMLHPPSTQQLSRDSGYFDILHFTKCYLKILLDVSWKCYILLKYHLEMLYPPSTQQLSGDSGYFDMLDFT